MSTVAEHIMAAEREGRHIESGFRDLMAHVYPRGVSEEQYSDLRKFFFAGASFLFAKTLNQMDDDREPTDEDMAFMTRVAKEIETFQSELQS